MERKDVASASSKLGQQSEREVVLVLTAGRAKDGCM